TCVTTMTRKPATNRVRANYHELNLKNSCKFARMQFVARIFVILLTCGCGMVSSSSTPPASTPDPFSPRPTATLGKSQSLYGIPREQALVLEGFESTNPREYDPATTHGSGDKLVFSGLVSFDPQLNLVADLAGSWQIAIGTVYTFTLRSDARFHNGRPVTAQDVIYSWERAADPKTNSDTVLTYLGDIVGVKEMHAGKAEHIAGLQAIDDRTLQVTIDAPK